MDLETEAPAVSVETALPNNLFLNLKKLARAVVETLGNQAEAIIHDFTDLEHSIVWIEGNVTGREIGGCVTDLGLVKLNSEEPSDLYNYRTMSPDGRTLKSSTVFLQNDEGATIGAFCINIDVSSLEVAEQVLRSLLWTNKEPEIEETFVDKVSDVLDTMLEKSVVEQGKPLGLMERADKVNLMSALDAKGAFRLKGAIPILANRLGVSRQTIYNYLDEARAASDGRSR